MMSATEPFDSAHMISYSTLIKAITSYLSKVYDFNLPHLHLMPLLSVTVLEFAKSLASETSTWATMWHCLHDPKFSHFDTIPECNRQMDGQTDIP